MTTTAGMVSTGPFAPAATWYTVAIPDTFQAPTAGYHYMAACRSNTGNTNVYATGAVLKMRLTRGEGGPGLGRAARAGSAGNVVDDAIPNMGVCTQPIVL